MAWIYVPDQASGVSSCSGQDCPQPSAMLSGTVTANDSSSNGLEMDGCQTPLSGTICGHSRGKNGPDELTSSLEASPASHTQQQASNSEKPTSVIYGPVHGNSLAAYDPELSFWRTYQASLVTEEGYEEYLGDWPKSGMMRNGRLWRLKKLVPPIKAGTESGLWPTPQARDWKGSSGRSMKGMEMDLPTAVKMGMVPTPTTGDNHYRLRGNSQASNCLGAMAARMGGGQLNPVWEEWLMGWPIGWTGCESLAMDGYHKWPYMWHYESEQQ